MPSDNGRIYITTEQAGLNAPSGAQCLPTACPSGPQGRYPNAVSMHLLVLSAFRHCSFLGGYCCPCCFVSMHLLVLSAFRPRYAHLKKFMTFPVSMHLLVLSAFRPAAQQRSARRRRSQCTFWCSVPSDSAPRKPRHNAVYRNEIAADLESATSNRLAPVQLNHTTAKNRHKPPAPPTPPTSQYATGFQRTQAKKPTPHDYAAVDTATKATDDCPLHRHDGLLPADRPTRADRRFPPTALLGPTAVSRRPPRPVGRRAPTIRRFHVNRRPPLAQPRWTK